MVDGISISSLILRSLSRQLQLNAFLSTESALNKVSGKLLQEWCYDDYSSHARMMTEIHARPPKSLASSSTAGISFRTVMAENCPTEGSSSNCEAASNGVKERPLSNKFGEWSIED